MKDTKILEAISEYVYARDLEGLKTALEKWPTVDLTKYNEAAHTLLHVAAKVEHSAELIKFLVEKGIDVNILDDEGRTPLYDAVLYECPNNLSVLIDLGGDVNLSDFEKSSPLVTACCHVEEHFACAKILLANGALINASSGNHLSSRTALEGAVYNAEDIDLVKFLIEQGADLDIEAPLMKAISIQNIEMIKLLVEKGATINRYININGENDLAFAKRVGNEEIIAYLETQLK